MMFMILGIGLFLLPILFRLAVKLRLGVPMLYAVLILTIFHGWYQAHTALAGGVVAKAEKITQANTMIQPSRQMAA